MQNPAAPRPNPVRPTHVKIDWLTTPEPWMPGARATIGLHFQPEPGWHLYWKNPGDSGQPPRVEWTFADGITVSPEYRWPKPERKQAGTLVTFTLSRDFVLETSVDVAGSLAGEQTAWRAKVRYLVCEKEVCVPERAELHGQIQIAQADSRASVSDSSARLLFEKARAEQPQALPAASAVRVDQTAREWILSITPAPQLPQRPSQVFFFADPALGIPAAAPQTVSVKKGVLEVRLSKGESAQPDQFSGVLELGPRAADSAFAVSVPLAAAQKTEASQALPASPALSLPGAVMAAFAGGLILNLMPCVFPVLWLKVLSFVRDAQSTAAQRLQGALAYALGILGTFWVLAGILMGFRAGGATIGWGFQLQAPGFVLFLFLLLIAVGLNLAGVFEVSLGRLTGVGSRWAHGDSWTGSFFTGVLATVVATPCTAPFMGVALGFALSQPVASAFLVFTALGLGLASPYVALAALPQASRFVPKPGAWMERLKQFLAFPIFFTALWLLWVLGVQAGLEGVLYALALAVGVGFVAWLAALGWGWGALILSVLLVVAGELALPRFLPDTRALSEVGHGVSDPSASVFTGRWSDARVRELLEAGRPVLVDFTAAWCVTCQVNERVAFGDAGVRAALRDRNIAFLKADWTNSDPAITRALESFGRNGVPLVVFYPSKAEQPRVLPQLLTPGNVLEALAPQAASNP